MQDMGRELILTETLILESMTEYLWINYVI